MPIPYQCTPEDYKEASAANGVWAKLDGGSGGVNRLPTVLTKVFGAALGLGIALAAILIPYGDRDAHTTWRVSPAALIVTSLALPAFFLLVIAQILVKLWRRPHSEPTGIVQSAVPRVVHGLSGRRAILAVAIWMLALAILAVPYLLGRSSPPLRLSPSAPPPAPAVQADGIELPFVAVFAMVFLPLIGMLMISAALQRRLQIKQYTEGQPQLFEAKTFDFDDAGISMTSPNTASRLHWPAIVKYAESEHLFLLYNSELTFHMVPKRALAQAGHLEAFIAVLTTRVPRGVLLPRPASGFPVQPIPAIPLPQDR